MGKIWETKGQIMRLLSNRAKTLTDISYELHLAPSTVAQHLKELKNAGAIEQIENPFVKKWKYYRVTSRTHTPSNAYDSQPRAPVKELPWIVAR